MNHSEAGLQAEPSDIPAPEGWAAIASLLDGFQPEQVDALSSARALEAVFPLLHALARGSLRDFIVRVAVLEALAIEEKSALSPKEVDEALYWLRDDVRETVLRTLRASGWLGFDAERGYQITDTGRFVQTVLSFLRGHSAQALSFQQ